MKKKLIVIADQKLAFLCYKDHIEDFLKNRCPDQIPELLKGNIQNPNLYYAHLKISNTVYFQNNFRWL